MRLKKKIKLFNPVIFSDDLNKVHTTCIYLAKKVKDTDAAISTISDLEYKPRGKKQYSTPFTFYFNKKTNSFFFSPLKKPYSSGSDKSFRPGIKVIISKDETTVTDVAILTVFQTPPSAKDSAKKRFHRKTAEREILFEMRDTPGISRLQGWAQFNNCKKGVIGQKQVFLMDLYGPDLQEMLNANELSTLSENAKIQIFLDVMKSVKALHDHGIMHCDLKLPNIMTEMKSQSLKGIITDFGHAFKPNTNHDDYGHGTKEYWAPEIVNEKLKLESAHFPKLDSLETDEMWPLGCVAYILFFNNTPEWFPVIDALHTQKQLYKNLKKEIATLEVKLLKEIPNTPNAIKLQNLLILKTLNLQETQKRHAELYDFFNLQMHNLSNLTPDKTNVMKNLL